jgi:hypothetical protein
MKILISVLFVLLVSAVGAMAVPTPAAQVVLPDWHEHAVSLLLGAIVLIGGLLSIIGVLLTRAINNNSATLAGLRDDIRGLFSRVEKTEQTVAYLRGQHEARTAMKLSCVVEGEEK